MNIHEAARAHLAHQRRIDIARRLLRGWLQRQPGGQPLAVYRITATGEKIQLVPPPSNRRKPA